MRTLISCCILLVMYTSAFGKSGYNNNNNAFERYNLDNGNLVMQIPKTMELDEEYRHYWDQCEGGGYTIFFTGPSDKNGSVHVQVNIHDWSADPEDLNSWNITRNNYISKSTVLQDTTYIQNGKEYTVFSAVNLAHNKGLFHKRGKPDYTNYTLSCYIIADGHMLEYHCFYWHKDAKDLDYWKNMSEYIASSMHWQNRVWATIP